MYEADKELGEARALRAQRRGQWLRWRSYLMLKESCLASPADEQLYRFWLRALERLQEGCPLPDWKSMWPGLTRHTRNHKLTSTHTRLTVDDMHRR